MLALLGLENVLQPVCHGSEVDLLQSRTMVRMALKARSSTITYFRRYNHANALSKTTK